MSRASFIYNYGRGLKLPGHNYSRSSHLPSQVVLPAQQPTRPVLLDLCMNSFRAMNLTFYVVPLKLMCRFTYIVCGHFSSALCSHEQSCVKKVPELLWLHFGIRGHLYLTYERPLMSYELCRYCGH